MAKSPPLFCETREVSFGGRGALCRALRLFCLSFACWVRELGDVGKVRRRCLSSLAVVRRPLACADAGLRSAQKKSAHVLCVCRLSFGWKRCFCLVQQGLRGHGEASAAGEDESKRRKEVEHGKFHSPTAGLGIDGAEVAEVHHGDGHEHVEGHDGGGSAGEKPNENGDGSEHFANHCTVGEEAGETFGGEHALEETDATLEFSYAVKKHESARAEAEEEQADVSFASHV